MSYLLIFSLAVLLALFLTPFVRFGAAKFGQLARPQKDRWHAKETALHGGIAIFVSYTAPLLTFIRYDQEGLIPLTVGATLMFILGLFDDFLKLQPYTKLIGQVVVTCLVIGSGIMIGAVSIPALGMLLTMFWIIGVTNAFNLLDNMDGLSAGTGCISAFFLGLAGLFTDNVLMASMGFSLCGATLGFLFYNFPPAKIFMGDSGSLFLGFVLAGVSLTGKWEETSSLFLGLLVPVLVLAVPIFDTTFVSLIRFFNGRSIAKGGRDHSSHRLVAFGLSEKRTVLFFYLMSLICGVTALAGLIFNLFFPAMVGILLFIVLWYFGLFLSGIVTYEEGWESKNHLSKSAGRVLNIVLLHKRRLGEIIVDCVLIAFSFTLAFAIRFDGLEPQHVIIVEKALPILIPLKLIIFFYFGLYRGLWRYVSLQDLISIVKAVTVSAVLSIVVITMAYRFEGYSRAVFLIDWMILLLAVGGTRVLVRLIKEYLATWTKAIGKRLLIMGAGDAGEIALREIRNNSGLRYVPVGFVDDDQQKQGRKIHGVPILGTREDISQIVNQYQIEEILVAIPSADKEALGPIISDCKKTGVAIQMMPRPQKFAGLVKS